MLTKINRKNDSPTKTKAPASHFNVVCQQIVNKITVSENFEKGYAVIKKASTDKKRPIIISFLNAHGFNLCLSNETFYQCIMESDFVFRDGIGMKFLLMLLNKDPGRNLNGTDFIPFLLSKFKNKRLALIGTKKNVLDEAVQHPCMANHRVVLCKGGFLPINDYIEIVAATKPEFLLLGMGMPKQEELSVLLKQSVPGIDLIVNGGAILDFMGKKIPRAPLIVRKVGLEWLFRLFLEPRRLFKRYVLGNATFLMHTFKMKRFMNRQF